ncbi:DegV family protein [Thermoanaerobacterium thermosaccharolyticum]|uniref:DegV family protein n=1 Tax=Thermoanaerobacterium thermosaccharolyticum TaxID=1517 RepID=UPI001782EF58|nr:DegV family protein [Thermoanaerobacterium thermosaccharolyticum]MBE0068306.1 DegV family protein [Thermoanaerobacterium thermosaccharolyticum]MBE0228170.1 DegV family protein [Thermoanaerobacterium thermosaccharolyticum]MCP2240359.1 DegV family protein with EDD domain [Thermoanaerobacterium thermosaccharolyticum]
MSKIAIVTDSVSDIPDDIVKLYDIYVVPLTIDIDGVSYKDGIDIKKDDFYNLLNSGKMPTTSQISPIEFMEVFSDLLKSYDEIICILLSSKLSGTYQSALLAKENLKNSKITVLDSKNFSLGAGLLAIEAAKMARNGNTRDEIVGKINDMISKISYIMIFDSLDYLYRGGRLKKSQAILGSILNIKPILVNNDGELEIKDKVRGRKNAIKWIINYMKETNVDFKRKEIGLLHTDREEFMLEIENAIRNEFGVTNFIKNRAGCSAGVHAGPYAVGIFFELD